jgi:peroxiredoxin Q/BCP
MALEVGKKAPDFALEDEAGNVVRLSDFKGKRVVVFFYSKAMTSG